VLFCVLAPLLIVRGGWWIWRRNARPAFGRFLMVLGVAMAGVYLWATLFAPYRLQVTHYVIESETLRGLERPLKVVVLADLQTEAVGDYERRVFAAIDAEQPDLLLVAGDLVQVSDVVKLEFGPAYEAVRADVVALFQGLQHKPPLGIYMVDGDVDPPKRGLDEAGVRLLHNASAQLAGGKLQVFGLGLEDSRFGLDLADLQREHPCQAPDFVKPMLETGITAPLLCIAGHTHGGQVVVPFFGPPMTLSSVPREIAAGGMHRIGDARLIVSRGIGLERGFAPRIRFLCPPELVVIELRAAQ
jgi:predicted MPP superfamily phosphohydrolase